MKNKVDQARQTLKEAGYFTDNLWQIDDVKESGWPDATDEQAMAVLEEAFANEATYEQIWLSIEYAIEAIQQDIENDKLINRMKHFIEGVNWSQYAKENNLKQK